VKEGSESLSIGKPWVFEGSYGTGITMRRFDERIVFVLKRVMLFWSETPLTLVYDKVFNDEKSARDYERLIKDKRTLKESLNWGN